MDGKDAPFFRAHELKKRESEQAMKKPKAPTIVVDKQFLLSESIIQSRWDENSKDNPEIQTAECIIYPQCLECGKWTICGDQMTYISEWKNPFSDGRSVANFVFSLKEEDITKMPLKRA